MLEVSNSEHTNLLLVSNPKPAANHLAYRDRIPLKIGADFFFPAQNIKNGMYDNHILIPIRFFAASISIAPG